MFTIFKSKNAAYSAVVMGSKPK